MNKALFLDRDGTINIDYDFVYKIEEFDFIDGIFDLCKKAQDLDYKIIIVTNQSGIERGRFTEGDVNILHNYVKDEFLKKGINITDVFICPFKDNSHPDRKPNPGMLLKAKEKYNLDMSKCIMVGDKERDIEAGINAGCGRSYLFSSNLEQTTKANKIYNDLKKLKEVL
ncbi:MAG: HAD family hydrolase [Alphaproteobacteria bacterium]|nr:HAD family hydrolase [Alphaproteobacteria bacterium]